MSRHLRFWSAGLVTAALAVGRVGVVRPAASPATGRGPEAGHPHREVAGRRPVGSRGRTHQGHRRCPDLQVVAAGRPQEVPVHPQGHVDEERQAGHRHQGGRCPRRARQRSDLTKEEPADADAAKKEDKPAPAKDDKAEGKKPDKPEEKADREPDVIYVPTPQDVVDKMLELAEVKKGDIVYDLGCGDARIPVTAAKKFGCKAWGFDIDPERIKDSLETSRRTRLRTWSRSRRKTSSRST